MYRHDMCTAAGWTEAMSAVAPPLDGQQNSGKEDLRWVNCLCYLHSEKRERHTQCPAEPDYVPQLAVDSDVAEFIRVREAEQTGNDHTDHGGNHLSTNKMPRLREGAINGSVRQHGRRAK